MPGVRTPTRAPIRPGLPRGLTVWMLALTLAVLTPFVAGIHTLVAHSGGAGHTLASHKATPEACDHGHGNSDLGALAAAAAELPHTGHSHSRPHNSPDPVPAEDCPTCVQLGLAGKCTDVPPAAAVLPLGQRVARAASPGPLVVLLTRPGRAAHPRAPPASA